VNKRTKILTRGAAGDGALVAPTRIMPVAVWVAIRTRLTRLVLILLQDGGLGCVLSGEDGVVRHQYFCRDEVVVRYHRFRRGMVMIVIVVAQRIVRDDKAFDIAFGVAEVGCLLSFGGVAVAVAVGVTVSV
jgi:hypothetical protein